MIEEKFFITKQKKILFIFELANNHNGSLKNALKLIEDAKLALTGMLDPDLQENFIGYAEIKQVFSVSKIGKIAGCLVTEGIVKKGCSFRLLRENLVIHQGMLKTLRRFKDEVKEVREGTECGMGFENYNDIQVGDLMECFEVKEVARSLESIDKKVG